MNIKILSFDPSLRNWGIAAAIYNTASNQLYIKIGKVITSKPDKSKIRQNTKDLNTSINLFNELKDIYTQADLVIAEVPHGSQSSRAMVSYGVCIGVLGSLITNNIPFIQVSALDVKRIVGHESVSKLEVIDWVKRRHPEILPWLPATNKAEHICDAIVAIYAAIQTKQFKELIHEIITKPS